VLLQENKIKKIQKRKPRNEKPIGLKTLFQMLKDGAENAIPYSETLGLRPLLHHQYPTPRWYHRMPPQLLSQPLSTHPMLSANPARGYQAVAILSH
jgi:hypothetical protein